MRVIGFTFEKILAEKRESYKIGGSINTNIEFTDIKKEEFDLIKDKETLKVFYKADVNYLNTDRKKESKDLDAQVSFEGSILVSTEKDESKEILKGWKNKKVSPTVQVPLYNFILRKCSTKAIILQEELNLPSHVPFPQIKLQPTNNQ
jgi:hypothetical protein